MKIMVIARGPDKAGDFLISQWRNSDGITAWILYQVGYNFLVSDDIDSVLEIIDILRPIDSNLAALLASKVDQTR